uniref:Anosmin 1b n=1 Tax=Hucho hucho TaxID=62062 RepID=A0A4W5RGI1_9TELE
MLEDNDEEYQPSLISLSPDPFPPEAPQSVRAGNETQERDGSSGGVQILWDPPKEGDLPVHHYKVTCSVRHAIRPSAQDRKDSARVTQGAVCEMDLQGLLPGTSYLIQVQAISYWGQKRLKSGRAQLTFTTKTTGQFSNELPSAPHLVNPAAPHLVNPLQVKVFWKRRHQETNKDSTTYVLRWYPHVCASNVSQTEKKATVQGTHYVITGLLFACKYRIAVALVAPEGDQRSEAVTAVTTPPCSAVMARGGKALPCAREERHLVSKKVVLRPEKLSAEFHTVNGSLQGLFRWQLSQTAPGQTPIAGFQFSWVQVSSSAMATEGQDTLISQTQIVAPDKRSLTVDWLQPDSVYKLQVQVLSAGGSGLSVARTLHTPPLNTTLL